MTSSSTLPAHWRLEPLGSRVSLLSGFAFDSSNFATEGGEALIRIRDLKVGRSETRYVGSYDERYLVMDGDFLIGMDGEFGCYKWQGGRALLNQRVCKLIGSSDVDLRFVAYGIGRHLKQIEQNTSYTTVKHLSARQIRAISFAFPRLAEQRRIADRLDEAMAEISAARSALKRQQIEIDAVQSRAAQEQFGGSPPVPMVEIIADTRNGLYKPEGYYGAGTPILKMFNIDRFANRITTERLDRLEATEQERKKGELRSGDILVNRVNSRDLVGKCACIGPEQEGFLFESKNLRLSVRSDKADPMYVALWLNSADARRQITDRLKQIAGMATISRPDLNALQIPLPSLDEQQRAVKEMRGLREAADAARRGLVAQFAALDALPNSLLSAAFRGEL